MSHLTLAQPEDLQFTVGAQRQEVMFKDGTAVTLHPVFDHGTPSLYHRALRLPKGVTMVVDLRSLVRQIGEDLCAAQARDVPGIVFFTLKHHYATAELLVRDVCLCGRALVDELHREAA